MKQCPKCPTLHDKPGIYCCRKCANSRIWTEEQNIKRGNALKGKTSAWRADVEKLRISVEKGKRTKIEKYNNIPFDELGPVNRRNKVFQEQHYKCNRCQLSEWQGEAIPLELEHKDANRQNNSRSNLEGLCPNCHALTLTYCRGANRPNKKKIMPG